MSEREKTYVEDVNRSIYDIRNEEKDVYRIKKGLTPDIVAEISEKKKDPAWMANFRLQSLQIYNEMEVPDWGPSIEGLNMEDIVTYVKPNTHMSAKWSEVPEDIKDTFEKLGIPQAERKSLAGVGAQYDSELVYHNVREEVAAQGVVYTDMESALKGEYADMVQSHFMKLVKPNDHKFAALHGAVWSGGSFVYVPPGVSVTIPLQSYFRLNAPGAGQFEHTLIIVDKGAYLHFIEGCSAPKYNVANLHAGCVELFVEEGATLRYSTIENWSKNMYNLNTKRALVKEGGRIEWVSGSFGSHTSCLYPMSILAGEGARMEFTGITFAGAGQDLDTGAKVDGFNGDNACTYGVGKIDLEAQRLLDVTKAALYKGIEQAKAGNRIGDIGYAVQSYCEDAGFSVVREFVGHGTGRELHEDPEVPNYGHQGRGPRLVPGMTIAIEPMICQYDCKITQSKDGWTVKTKDGGLAAHFEHSNAILKDHTEIMTRFWDDPDFDPETFSLK